MLHRIHFANWHFHFQRNVSIKIHNWRSVRCWYFKQFLVFDFCNCEKVTDHRSYFVRNVFRSQASTGKCIRYIREVVYFKQTKKTEKYSKETKDIHYKGKNVRYISPLLPRSSPFLRLSWIHFWSLKCILKILKDFRITDHDFFDTLEMSKQTKISINQELWVAVLRSISQILSNDFLSYLKLTMTDLFKILSEKADRYKYF